MVSEDRELFNSSVFNNIAYGLPEGFPVAQQAKEYAAKEVFAHDFVQQLPQSYDTLVG